MGKRGQKSKASKQAPTRKTGQVCRGPPPEQQNVKAVSVRHCAATTAPRNCCPNCYAEQSHRDYVRSSAVGKQLKQKKSNSLSLAQHHLPALDLSVCSSFFVRVQLTSLLLVSPGLCSRLTAIYTCCSYLRHDRSERYKQICVLKEKSMVFKYAK